MKRVLNFMRNPKLAHILVLVLVSMLILVLSAPILVFHNSYSWFLFYPLVLSSVKTIKYTLFVNNSVCTEQYITNSNHAGCR